MQQEAQTRKLRSLLTRKQSRPQHSTIRWRYQVTADKGVRGLDRPSRRPPATNSTPETHCPQSVFMSPAYGQPLMAHWMHFQTNGNKDHYHELLRISGGLWVIWRACVVNGMGINNFQTAEEVLMVIGWAHEVSKTSNSTSMLALRPQNQLQCLHCYRKWLKLG